MAAPKKGRALPKKMSLKDRLARHWEAGKWEAFVSLYLRDRAASEQTPWAGRYVDALYNCLTQSLFLHHSLETAQELAGLLLEAGDKAGSGAEAPDRRRDDIARDCARVALDFLAMRREAGAVPSSLAAEDDLPEPWRALRAGLRSAAEAPRRRGRKSKSETAGRPAAVLLAKLSAQFQALPRARNLRLFSSFLQTAEALEKETAGQPGAANFKAVRIIAELLRELGGPKRGGDGLRDVADLQSHQLLRQMPAGAGHPAVLSLWNFFCERGGLKFGGDWAAAARALRLRFDRSRPELAEAFQALVNSGPERMNSLDIFTVSDRYGQWTEPEQYLLGHAFCLALNKDGPRALANLPGTAMPACFRRLTELGRKWRPAKPWAAPASDFLEVVIRGLGNQLAKIPALDAPYECLTTPTLVLMVVMSPQMAARIADSAASRLPLILSEADDIDQLGFDFSLLNPPPNRSALSELKKFLEKDSLAALLSAWVKSLVESSAVGVAENGEKARPPWEGLTPDLLAFMIEHLPADDPAGRFVRLGRGRRALSDDPQELGAFIQALARSQNTSLEKEADPYKFMEDSDEPVDGFAGNLFIMLTAWPQVDLNFMVDLFCLGQGFLFDDSDLWSKAVEAVGHIKNADRRRALAQRLFAFLKKAVDPERREARRCFDNLQKGRKANPNLNKFRNPFEAMFSKMGGDVGRESAGDFDDFEAEMMNRFKNLMGRRRTKKN